MKAFFVALILLVGPCLLPLQASAEETAENLPARAEGVEGETAATETIATRPPARSLVGTPWKQLPSAAKPKTRLQGIHYLIFKERGELAAVGECAYLWGKYRLDGDDALLVTDFRAKRKGCANAAGGDQGFISTLIMANTYRIEGTELSLYRDGERLMSFGATAEMPAVERVEHHRVEKRKKNASTKVHKPKAKTRKKKARH